MFCGKCGNQLNDGVKFCTKCGASVGNVQTPPTQPVFQQQVNTQPQYYQQPVDNTTKMSAWGYFVSAMKKYVVFNGRARRAEFWFFTLFYTIFSFVAGFIDGFTGLMITESYGILSVLLTLAFFLPGLSVTVRRMHDCDKAGPYMLIPIYGLILLFTAGTVGPNRYGQDPKQTN